MTARLVAALLLLSLLLTAPQNAQADERRRVVVVPTELGGFFLGRDEYRREVDLALTDRLRAAQFVVLPRAALSKPEEDCREFACLERIAIANGASIVVAGRLVNNQRVEVSYHLRVRIVEKVNGQFTRRAREKDCDNCTEPQARDSLATLMSAVIANEPAETPAHAPTVEPKAPPLAPPAPAPSKTKPPLAFPVGQPTAATRDRFTRSERLAFKLGGAVLGAAGIGLLAQGFVELTHNGDVVTTNGQRFRVDTTTTGQPLFFSLGAASLIAGGALELLGWLPWQVKVAPVVSASGANVQVGGSF